MGRLSRADAEEFARAAPGLAASLHELRLGPTDALADLSFIGRLTSLASLDMPDTVFVGSQIACLRELRQLTELSCSWIVEGGGVTDAELAGGGALPVQKLKIKIACWSQLFGLQSFFPDVLAVRVMCSERDGRPLPIMLPPAPGRGRRWAGIRSLTLHSRRAVPCEGSAQPLMELVGGLDGGLEALRTRLGALSAVQFRGLLAAAPALKTLVVSTVDGLTQEELETIVQRTRITRFLCTGREQAVEGEQEEGGE